MRRGFRFDHLHGDAQTIAGLPHAAIQNVEHAKIPSYLARVGRFALIDEAGIAAITNSHLIRDSPVLMSSTIPSAKYSCSGSPLMFWRGRTAIEGLSGRESCTGVLSGAADLNFPARSDVIEKAHTGRAMFFRVCSPRSKNSSWNLSRDAAGLANGLKPRSDIDCIAHEFPVGLLDDVAQMDANAELDAPIVWQAGVALAHPRKSAEATR